MELTPERLIAQLATEPLRPAYLIAGPEPLRVLEAGDAVRARARAQGITEREVFEADARDFDWDTLTGSFRAPSLFSARRLVELRLPTARPGKDGGEVIVGFCADPPPDVVLLVTGGEWSRQHGGKWSEAIARVGHTVPAWAIKAHELPDWIERRLRSRGLRADRDAVLRLAERVEGNLLAAAQEIDKLGLLVAGHRASSRESRAHDLGQAEARAPTGVDTPVAGPSLGREGVLSADDMDALVADAARFDVFRLIDAALNGQPAQVSRMLAGLRAEGEVVPALLGMVVRELQATAALARTQAGGGNPGSSPGQALAAGFKAQHIWESKQAMFRRALQRHSAPCWDRFVVEAGRVDRISKGRVRAGSEPADPWLALERLLLAVAEARALPLLAS
ncbi:MAG: DNA polymerase III subunit delta [Gammaproteobacteria bacterium]|nr:DNA polymerase III subunit delta [Gammaproteobacteria bacterium]